MPQQMYTTSEYLDKNPSWHVEDSPWKARHICEMITRNGLAPRRVCEVGCGAGEVLRQLQLSLGEDVELWGYDISAQAIELAQARANDRLHFVRKDLASEPASVTFDLTLAIDLLEHLEDYYAFLRRLAARTANLIVHFPLDLHLTNLVLARRFRRLRENYGHIHYFTKDTAIRALHDAGFTVIDHFYTEWVHELPEAGLRGQLQRYACKLLMPLAPDLTARVFGGSSLLILARPST